MYFNPTIAQINAANNLLIASAFHTIVKADFEQFTASLLATKQYFYDTNYCKGMLKTIHDVPDDGILLNPDHRELMHGMTITDNYTQDASAYRYFADLKKAALAAGYQEGELTPPLAKHEVNKKEDAFLSATQNIHEAQHLSLVPFETRTKLITQLLNFFHARQLTDDFLSREATYFNSWLTKQENTPAHAYTADEPSFKRFKAYKRSIPMSDFLTAHNQSTPSVALENVASLWAYLPGCHIFEMKERDEWKSIRVPFITPRYIYVSTFTKQTYKGNELKTLESCLYKEFVAAIRY